MNTEDKKPHYLGHRKRLRNRFLNQGIDSLQEYEVIELFLTFIIPQRDVKEPAKEIIEKFGSVKGFFEADENSLKQIKFFKEKALTLRRFIKEIVLLYQKQLAEEIPLTISREQLIKYCINRLGHIEEEQFWMFSLDSKYSIIKENLISKGLIDKAPVYPRKIIEQAVHQKAFAILLVHNHPNGKLKASEHDITITKAINIPAKVLNIKLYDHIIVAGNDYLSFKDRGLL
ncbi:MAG: DNA repair protein RadC [Bacteroidales bacterium]|nr:DNA repair protein RadC [Bacteroidales bacterium]